MIAEQYDLSNSTRTLAKQPPKPQFSLSPKILIKFQNRNFLQPKIPVCQSATSGSTK